MAVPVKYLKKTRTEPALKSALLAKMETKPLARITIKELCEAADIYRSTFYCHYNDVESLYAALENDIFTQINKTYNALVAGEITARDYCKTLVDMVKNNPLELITLFRLNTGDSKAFCEKLVACLIEQVKALYPNLEGASADCLPAFIVSGAIGCVLANPERSTDEVVDSILSICSSVN